MHSATRPLDRRSGDSQDTRDQGDGLTSRVESSRGGGLLNGEDRRAPDPRSARTDSSHALAGPRPDERAFILGEGATTRLPAHPDLQELPPHYGTHPTEPRQVSGSVSGRVRGLTPVHGHAAVTPFALCSEQPPAPGCGKHMATLAEAWTSHRAVGVYRLHSVRSPHSGGRTERTSTPEQSGLRRDSGVEEGAHQHVDAAPDTLG